MKANVVGSDPQIVTQEPAQDCADCLSVRRKGDRGTVFRLMP